MRFNVVVIVFFWCIMLMTMRPALCTTQVSVAGQVAFVITSTEFVYQTGHQYGYVPVMYTEPMVVPSGSRIAVGQSVTVAGSFNARGQLLASNVTIGGTAPYHITTWANDVYWGPGSRASKAQVAQLASYAESGLGNSKALDDCKAYPGTCKSVYYFDVNMAYASPTCPYMPDAAVLSSASENWFVHQAGYTDSAHRIFGMYSQLCLGSRISIPVWAPNDGSPSLQSWWSSELHNYADGYDLGFMDDEQSTIVDQYYFNSGGGCLPWPSYCWTTQEIPTDAALRANHASFANSMNHVNGQPWKFAFNSLSFDGLQVSAGVKLFSASSRFGVGSCEGCAISNGRVFTVNYSRILDTMAAATAANGAFMLHSTDSAPAGSSTQLFERLVTTGLIWLGYSEGHTIAWPDLEDTTTNLAVWPEDLIYPANPVQTMTTGGANLQVTPGVWRREFTTCAQAGHTFGRCAAIVNSRATAITVASVWLSQGYGHVVSISGGDVLSGGLANISSTPFYPNVTVVPAGSALLLAQ